MTVGNSVKVNDLISNGYLDEKKVKKLDTNYYIVFCSSEYKYKSSASC